MLNDVSYFGKAKELIRQNLIYELISILQVISKAAQDVTGWHQENFSSKIIAKQFNVDLSQLADWEKNM